MPDSPVVFIVFNRPSQTMQAFARIAQAKPSRLLVVADGPRQNKPGEAERCEEVRRLATAVDWPCKVEVNFAQTNMGCRDRIVSGLDWAFERIEEAIILEDDIVPDLSFFRFSSEMLQRYRDDDRIAMIAAFNPVEQYVSGDSSYYFSRLPHVWGWATWRRVWKHYDKHLKSWPEIRRAGVLKEIFSSSSVVSYWTRIFESMHSGTGPDTWDYQWVYTNLINNRLCIVPRRNLVKNLGFGPDATHTLNIKDTEMIAGSLDFPLVHPLAVVPSQTLDRHDIKLSGFMTRSVPARAAGKMKQIVRDLRAK